MGKRNRNKQPKPTAPTNDLPNIPWNDTNAPTYTLDDQIALARSEMGEARWAELQREWVND